MRLTDLSVRSLPIPEKSAKIYHCDQTPGFGVRVTPSGFSSYVLTYGVQRERITLGRVGVISLKDARALARERLAERTLGKHRPKRITFIEAVDLFIEAKKPQNRERTVTENARILRKYWKTLHKMQLDDIRSDHLSKVLDKLRDTPGTALHCFWTMRTFLRWCRKRRYISTNPIEELDPPAKLTKRRRVLDDKELKAILQTAPKHGTFGKLVLMLLYTGCRRSEGAAMRAEWFRNGICTLPAELCKNGEEHRFPYRSLVASLLVDLPDEGLLFPSAKGGPWNSFSKPKIDLDNEAKVQGYVLHDLRRTMASWLQPHIPKGAIEALLNHISGERSGLTGIYQQYEWRPEMEKGVTLWNDHLTTLASS